jgi:GTPase-activating protein SAC7
MSHPTHELSPTEHRLSQEVLEFLIAHQDWFMLDTPPPPALSPVPSRSLTPPLTSAASVSVSDDEGPDGWRIIDRHARPSADRGKQGAGTSGAAAAAQTMPGKGERDNERSPGNKSISGGAPGIVRSRTVPSTRKSRASTVDPAVVQRGTPGASGSAFNPAVLRKARRASAQPI